MGDSLGDIVHRGSRVDVEATYGHSHNLIRKEELEAEGGHTT